MAFYVDTSAFLKLVRAEPHSKALAKWVEHIDRTLVGSDLLRAEALRTARRESTAHVSRARECLAMFPLLRVSVDAWQRAGELEPAGLRTLDALHLALALSLGPELEGVVTYDRRLAEACVVNGVQPLSPGMR